MKKNRTIEKFISIAALLFTWTDLAAATIVRFNTNMGNFDVELYDDGAPLTVQNFLNYVTRGAYANSVVHRSVPGFVIQGGGYTWDPLVTNFSPITQDPPVQNEFDVSRSNLRGTIAMAKRGFDANSATSEWFFNLIDNTSLDDPSNNGGYTVFGHVLDDGMEVIDAIATLPRSANVYYLFGELPVQNYTEGTMPVTSNLVIVNFVCKNSDRDSGCDGVEDGVNADGDGNGDGVADRLQPNVVSFRRTYGDYVTAVTEQLIRIEDARSPAFTLSQEMLAGPGLPRDRSLAFNYGLFSLRLSGVAMGSAEMVLTLPEGDVFNVVYLYGPTSDNQEPHWYEFMYDGETGATISGNVITLHFLDGGRGDDDLTVNGEVRTTAGPALATPFPDTGGCALVPNSGSLRKAEEWWLLFGLLVCLRFIQHQRRSATVRRRAE